jgi:hypothetical protein
MYKAKDKLCWFHWVHGPVCYCRLMMRWTINEKLFLCCSGTYVQVVVFVIKERRFWDLVIRVFGRDLKYFKFAQEFLCMCELCIWDCSNHFTSWLTWTRRRSTLAGKANSHQICYHSYISLSIPVDKSLSIGTAVVPGGGYPGDPPPLPATEFPWV